MSIYVKSSDFDASLHNPDDYVMVKARDLDEMVKQNDKLLHAIKYLEEKFVSVRKKSDQTFDVVSTWKSSTVPLPRVDDITLEDGGALGGSSSDVVLSSAGPSASETKSRRKVGALPTLAIVDADKHEGNQTAGGNIKDAGTKKANVVRSRHDGKASGDGLVKKPRDSVKVHGNARNVAKPIKTKPKTSKGKVRMQVYPNYAYVKERLKNSLEEKIKRKDKSGLASGSGVSSTASSIPGVRTEQLVPEGCIVAFGPFKPEGIPLDKVKYMDQLKKIVAAYGGAMGTLVELCRNKHHLSNIFSDLVSFIMTDLMGSVTSNVRIFLAGSLKMEIGGRSLVEYTTDLPEPLHSAVLCAMGLLFTADQSQDAKFEAVYHAVEEVSMGITCYDDRNE